MEKLRKTVIIGCLIYGLYGLISWLDVGVFVPPIPLKPFLFATFFVFFVYDDYQGHLTVLNISFLIWLATLVFIGQYLVETFFDYNTVDLYINTIEPYILLGSMISFIVFVSILSKRFEYPYILTLILSTLAILILLSVILIGKQAFYDWGIAVVALLFFIFNWNKDHLNENYQKMQMVLNGVAIINVLEKLAFMLQ